MTREFVDDELMGRLAWFTAAPDVHHETSRAVVDLSNRYRNPVIHWTRSGFDPQRGMFYVLSAFSIEDQVVTKAGAV